MKEILQCDDPPPSCQQFPQAFACIATVVPIDLVVPIPEHHGGGNGKEQFAAWAKHAEHVAHGLAVIFNMFDDVQGRNQVELKHGVLRIAQRPVEDTIPIRRIGGDERIIDLDAADIAKSFELPKKQAVTTTDIENFGGLSDIETIDHLEEDLFADAKPPMVTIEFFVDLTVVFVHEPAGVKGCRSHSGTMIRLCRCGVTRV